MHLTSKNIGELNRPADKLLPPITKDRFGEYIPQNWYHLRIKQHERVAYLEDLYKRFKAITRKQKEYRENKPEARWEEYPIELMEELAL